MGGDLGALKETKSGEPVGSRDQLVSIAMAAYGDWVDQAGGCDLVTEPMDRVWVVLKPGVGGMFEVDGVKRDMLELGVVRWGEEDLGR